MYSSSKTNKVYDVFYFSQTKKLTSIIGTRFRNKNIISKYNI